MKYQIRDGRATFLRLSPTVLEKYGKYIGPIGIAVYCALAKYADNDTRESWPSHKTMADLIGTSSRSVKTYIGKLASVGLVEIEARHDDEGRRTSNLYILTSPEKWKEIPPTGQEAPIPQEPEIPRIGTPGAYKLDSIELDSVNYSPGVPGDSPVPKRKKHAPSKADPRTSHAAIQCVRTVTKRRPPKDLYDDIIEALGDSPDVALAQKCYKEWRIRGYAATSMIPFVEWYPKGGPSYGKRKSNGRVKADVHTSDEWMEAWRNTQLGESVTARLAEAGGT